ncbi:MAG TPA: PLP-dependent aminotransferase family protein [Steroidobacteraceae bacterium]|nr:PLP-dependent aminotransferase family protein [Steroidobacteraceae bacterium]
MLRPWDIHIRLRRSSQTPMYLQIVHALINEIRRGRLGSGAALPGSRELAESLNVNRKTVVQAYAELAAQGWVLTEATRGTFVSAQLPTVESTDRDAAPGRIPDVPEFRVLGGAPRIPVVLPEPGTLVFDDGAPDSRDVPIAALARAYRRALWKLSRRGALNYGDPRGQALLRAAVSSMLNLDRGLSTTADQVCITRGSQMAIFLIARILAERGDTVVLEELSYQPAHESFRAAGAEVIAAGLDGAGLRVEELEAICRRRRVRAVYLTPHHQFPTTVLMPPDRRLKLFALAAQFGFAIVEDDYDHEFHFAHQPMLPLASADPYGRVVYIGSMSKLLSPSLRLGYVAAPTAVIDRMAAEITMIDRQGDPAIEVAVAELIELGELHRHTRKVLQRYRERRALMAQLLGDAFDDRVTFTLPDGGLAVWLRFDAGVDLTQLAQLARAERVQFMPSAGFSVNARPVPGLRLGFASLNETELRRAVQRLDAAYRRLALN